MRIRFVGAVAFVASVWAVGCSSNATHEARDEGVSATAQAIQGGTSDTTHTFAVGVCGGAKGQCQFTCSGALIAPNLVVTARHCVEQTLLNGQPSEVVDCSA